MISCSKRDFSRASWLFGAAEGCAIATGSSRDYTYLTELEHSIAATRAALGQETDQRIGDLGRGASLESAVAYALRE